MGKQKSDRDKVYELYDRVIDREATIERQGSSTHGIARLRGFARS